MNIISIILSIFIIAFIGIEIYFGFIHKPCKTSKDCDKKVCDTNTGKCMDCNKTTYKCPSGYECGSDGCTKPPPPPPTCSTFSCLPQVCNNGTCVNCNTTTVQCPSNYSCNNDHKCVLRQGVGIVYIVSTDGNVYALNADTGTTKWVFKTNLKENTPYLGVSKDGTSIYVTIVNSLIAINTKGTQISKYTGPLTNITTLAVSPDNANIYLPVYSSDSGTTELISVKNGTTPTLSWTFKGDGNGIDTPIITSDSSTIFASTFGSPIYKISSDGKTFIKLKNTPQGMSHITLSTDYKYIYVVGKGGIIQKIDVNNNEIMWTTKVKDVFQSISLSPDGKYVYSLSYNNYIYAFETTKGQNIWSYNFKTTLPSYFYKSSPIFSPDGTVLYVGSLDKNIYAFNSTTGKIKWKYPTDGWIFLSHALSLDGKTLYVSNMNITTTNSSTLYAINTSNGTKKWVFQTPTKSVIRAPVYFFYQSSA
jgi:outer membrane protein assembly factor BamB